MTVQCRHFRARVEEMARLRPHVRSHGFGSELPLNFERGLPSSSSEAVHPKYYYHHACKSCFAIVKCMSAHQTQPASITFVPTCCPSSSTRPVEGCTYRRNPPSSSSSCPTSHGCPARSTQATWYDGPNGRYSWFGCCGIYDWSRPLKHALWRRLKRG